MNGIRLDSKVVEGAAKANCPDVQSWETQRESRPDAFDRPERTKGQALGEGRGDRSSGGTYYTDAQRRWEDEDAARRGDMTAKVGMQSREAREAAIEKASAQVREGINVKRTRAAFRRGQS